MELFLHHSWFPATNPAIYNSTYYDQVDELDMYSYVYLDASRGEHGYIGLQDWGPL